MKPLPFERHWRRFDPRESLAARLLLASFLAFLLPAVVFIFLVQRRLAGMQSALLYPLNWLFLVLPLTLAMNLTVVLNAWLLGSSMAAWAS